MRKFSAYFKTSITSLSLIASMSLSLSPSAYSQPSPPMPSANTVSLNNTRKSELDDSMDKMHNSMAIKYSTNADYDFMRSMLAHHEGALDMAQIQLKYGQDEKVLKLAQSIIKSQNKEIKTMKSWIEAYEKANNISAVPARPSAPATSALTAPAKPVPHKH